MFNVDLIIEEITNLEKIFLQCKSVFPALSDTLIGKNSFETAEYYTQRGFKVSIHTNNPITQDFINKNSQIGKWINENAIIRLYGIMSYHRVAGGGEDKDRSGNRGMERS